MRAKIIGILSIVALVSLGFPPSASAATSCTGEDLVRAKPGLSGQGSSGPFASIPDKGKHEIRCSGTIQGGKVTGVGRLTVEGRYGDEPGGSTCQAGGRGHGVQTMVIPTDKGEKTIKNTFTFDYKPDARAHMVGKWNGDNFAGSHDNEGTNGDCVSAPVTEFIQRFKFTYVGK